MRLYFLSSQPAVLKIGGAYFGQVGDFEKFAEIHIGDNLFAEFIPQGALPVCFFLSENLLFSPPDGVELYLTKNGAAIFVKDYPPVDYSLRLIAQKRCETALITVFKQGETQAVIENGKDLFCAKLPKDFAPADIEEINGVYMLKSPDAICLLNAAAEILLYRKYSAYTRTENGFSLIRPLFSSLRQTAKERFRLENGGLEREEYTLLSGEREENRLIAYAFFESVLIGGDYKSFLSDELKEKADDIKGFLGEFLSVLLTDDENQVGIIKNRRKQVFEVVYYKVEIKDGKICDIHG